MVPVSRAFRSGTHRRGRLPGNNLLLKHFVARCAMAYLPDHAELEFIRESVLLSRRWRAKLDERLKPCGLTLARSTVLYWLDQSTEVMTQRELADIVGIEGPTLVRQLHALEAQGLIERVPVAHDRRAKGIRLTESARPLLDTLNKVSRATADEFLAKLDRRRLGSATKLLREARESLS